MYLTVNESANISCPCDIRSERRKWMGICRFEVDLKSFLFHFRLLFFEVSDSSLL